MLCHLRMSTCFLLLDNFPSTHLCNITITLHQKFRNICFNATWFYFIFLYLCLTPSDISRQHIGNGFAIELGTKDTEEKHIKRSENPKLKSVYEATSCHFLSQLPYTLPTQNCLSTFIVLTLWSICSDILFLKKKSTDNNFFYLNRLYNCYH